MENVEKILRDFVGEDAGRAVAVCDLARPGKVCAVNGDQPMLAASVLKLPLVMRAAEMMAAGTLDGGEAVPVADMEVARWSNILAVLDRPQVTVRELCGLSLAASDNSTAAWLFARIGAAPVNDMMARLGCGAGNVLTHSFNEAVLNDRARQHENTLTAAGAVTLLQAVWTQPVYAPVKAWLYHGVRGPRLRGYLSHLDVYNKTGSLAGVVNDIGIVREGERAVALAVFMQGHKDGPMAAVETGRMARAVWQVLAN